MSLFVIKNLLSEKNIDLLLLALLSYVSIVIGRFLLLTSTGHVFLCAMILTVCTIN